MVNKKLFMAFCGILADKDDDCGKERILQMSLDKAIEHGKEHRKQYRKYCEAIDKQCRPHGGCDYCKSNRLFKRGNGQITMGELEDEEDDYKE